jgi:hypothetical protein
MSEETKSPAGSFEEWWENYAKEILGAEFKPIPDRHVRAAYLAGQASVVASSGAGVVNENMCDCCAGTGKPVSGLPCACNGTGKMSVAAEYFREQWIKERHRAEILDDDYSRLRKRYDEIRLNPTHKFTSDSRGE